MFAESLTIFFNTDEFAIAATVGAATVKVIFDAPNIETFGIAGIKPTALIVASDSTVAAVGATIIISGTSYVIRDQSPEDDGAIVRLQLETV